MTDTDLKKLDDKFAPNDIEWRIGRAGEKGGKPWATCLAYVTNRAIMERLDSVCGKGGWKNEYTKAPEGGVLCGISIKIEEEWITKWDGAENTQIESVKGGLSSSMKRAAVQWGVGRYLYDLEEGFANIHQNGTHYQSANKGRNIPAFKWDAPKLPSWALPEGHEQTEPAVGNKIDNPNSTSRPADDPELLGIGEQMKDALALLAEKADPAIVDGYKADGVRLYRKKDKTGLRALVKKVQEWKPTDDPVEAAQRVFADDIPEDIY